MMTRVTSPKSNGRRNSALILIHLVGFIALSGCTMDGYPLENSWHTQGKAPSAAPPPSTFAYRYPDAPAVMNEKDLQTFLGRFRHRVVLLHFWASWSNRSRQELASLARMQDELQNEGFQVIACNLDAPDHWSSDTVPMLHAARANYPCLIIPQAAKPGIRKWLDPQWSFDLPARFVCDRHGQITGQYPSSVAIASVEAQVRHMVRHGGSGVRQNLVSTGNAAGLRVKLIDCAKGTGEYCPEVNSNPADPQKLASLAVPALSSRLDPSRNPRIAILPFGSLKGRTKAGEFGIQTARRIEEQLREKGFYDFVPGVETQAVLDRADLSAMALDYDPTLASQHRLGFDYLIIGWIRGDAGVSARPRTVAKSTSDVDSGQESRRNRLP